MLPTVVAEFVKKWFDEASPPKDAADPRFLPMPAARYREMMHEWRATVHSHLPSAIHQETESLDALLYLLNITLRITGADQETSDGVAAPPLGEG